jgi:hypothetical protein
MHAVINLRKSKDVGMNEHRPAATLDAAVMADYFETMRQFLDMQGQVMAAFMGGGADVARVPVPVHRGSLRAPVPRSAEPAPHAIVPPSAHAPFAAPRTNGVVAHAGAPIAPISTAQASATLPQAVKEAAEPPTARNNGVAKIAPATEAVVDRGRLINILLDIVEEKTGYPRDMVGLDQNLEADLGIDSIKRIEVVGAMLQSLPEKQREALTAHRSRLNTQATLNGMLELLASSIEKADAA